MQTSVLGEGRLGAAGVWTGNLALKGGGDPTLDRAGLARLAEDVRAAGVRRVTGSLVADESWFDSRRSGPAWKAGFVPFESQALSALAIEGVADAAGTARLFRGALARAGVQVAGGTKIARAGGWPLAVHWSPPLAEILRHMDVVSDNFTAELVLKQRGRRRGGDDRRGSRGRPLGARRTRRPARGCSDRRRLRPVQPRPDDPEGAGDDPPARLGRP
jgi:D-alanyl-D-alanine carboxypeptidase/D-alanyl-D-alanine-endopeptidase (penicillin-binding protein 4)